jgi:DNA-binding HxlR family transcriptional regulator
VLVLAAVAQGMPRNGELRRRVRGISQKMLTQPSGSWNGMGW